jgi:antitoxin component YwqK of YwqJK toxin-antitoxin module
MKHILTSVVLLVLLFPALALGGGVMMDDLVFRDGLHYKKFADVPFTGEVTGKKQGSIRNGKKDGPWVRYHDNGRIEGKGTYKDGERDGPWVNYHDNGRLLSKGTYRDGKADGPWVLYYDTGQLWSKETYKDGDVYGPRVSYYPRSVLQSLTGTYKDGDKVD